MACFLAYSRSWIQFPAPHKQNFCLFGNLLVYENIPTTKNQANKRPNRDGRFYRMSKWLAAGRGWCGTGAALLQCGAQWRWTVGWAALKGWWTALPCFLCLSSEHQKDSPEGMTGTAQPATHWEFAFTSSSPQNPMLLHTVRSRRHYTISLTLGRICYKGVISGCTQTYWIRACTVTKFWKAQNKVFQFGGRFPQCSSLGFP